VAFKLQAQNHVKQPGLSRFQRAWSLFVDRCLIKI